MKKYKDINLMGERWNSSTKKPYKTRNMNRWLTEHSKILTIGSCFAVNFARWISLHNIYTTAPDWGLHYNTKTIIHELLTCSEGEQRNITWAVKSVDGNLCFHDARRHPISRESELELSHLQAKLQACGKIALESSTAFVITFGLSELWEQQIGEEWHHLNRAPLTNITSDKPLNFRNRFQTVAEIKSDLLKIIKIIYTSHHRSVPIVFTVSPIPLKTSGMPYDPRIANVRSKSNLVAAIHELLDEHPGLESVSYFPAFEMFFQSPGLPTAWQQDGRHVTAEKIDSVCRMFISIYAKDTEKFNKNINFTVPEV
ncbi:GSCFA domain-containing protein [Pseudomonas putida]|uniref:GSCFA domain-containing protein n=1 Tax=Pseudomonas putida TaxID=303 RepID=UPI0009BC8B17|nr:GSCFA domain-containing protein [Pseudomonas putida]